MKLIIDGQEISKSDYNWAELTSITISELEASGLRERLDSKEYVLTGAAYEIVREALIDNPNGKNEFLPVKIYEDTCCPEDVLLFEGILRGDSAEWCYNECSVKVHFFEHTEETRKITCLKSTLIYDNWNGFQQASHPRMVYCIEMRPDMLAHLVLIFGVILNIIFTVLTPVVFVLSLIISALNAVIDFANNLGANFNHIDFDGNSATNTMQEFQNFRDRMNQRLVGCGRKHPSPLVRSYIQNVCDKCGVQFSSTIYNNPASDYYNAVMVSAPIVKGTLSEANTYIIENRANETLDTFLDKLKLLHNADYRLIDDTLYFERKDYFYTGGIYVNYASLEEMSFVTKTLCVSWRDEEKPSFIKMHYSLDALDAAGNEAGDRYNDIVEWNQPVSELQSGFKEVAASFGMARFRDDGVDEDILSNYSGAPGIGNTIDQFQGVMILEKGVAFQPKLVIWDGGDLSFARAQKYDVAGNAVNAPDLFPVLYNFPYFFTELFEEPNTAYPSNEPNMGLYGRFYSIDNPKLIIDQGLSFTFTFKYNCDTLQGAYSARYVQLPYGVGRITKTTVDLKARTITISGEV